MARALDEAPRYLGAGVANLINLVNPRRIVLGGWVGQRIGPYILPRLWEVVARDDLAQPLTAAMIVLGQPPPDAVAMGAATLALDTRLTEVGHDHGRRSRHKVARATA